MPQRESQRLCVERYRASDIAYLIADAVKTLDERLHTLLDCGVSVHGNPRRKGRALRTSIPESMLTCVVIDAVLCPERSATRFYFKRGTSFRFANPREFGGRHDRSYLHV